MIREADAPDLTADDLRFDPFTAEDDTAIRAAVPPGPSFLADNGRYVCRFNAAITFEADRLRRKWGEVWCELVVQTTLAGAATGNRDLYRAEFNLSILRSRQELAKHLANRAHTKDLDWFTYCEEFCQRVLAADRAGQPAVHLRDLERPAPDADVDVLGVRLLRRHPVIAFGDGDSLKSMLALYIAGTLARTGMRIAFCDWEFSGEDHRDRLERLFGPSMPDVLYVRCDRALAHEQDRLTRIFRDERIDYCVIDSVAPATDGPPEAAEAVAAFFRTLRALNVGSLNIAHINKSEQGDQKPFGSAFWHNLARATYFVQREQADLAGDGRSVTIGLFNRKANTGPRRPAVGIEFTFGADRTAVRRVDLAEVADLAVRLPLWQKIAGTLRHGPQTYAAIAKELGAKLDSVEKAVKRSNRTFTRVEGHDGITRIALLERRSA